MSIIKELRKVLPQDCFLYETDTIVIRNKKQMRETIKILNKYTPIRVGVGCRRITYKGPNLRLFTSSPQYDAGLEQMVTDFLIKYSQKIHPKF
jgi:hypothetical protein